MPTDFLVISISHLP